jgi:hypothetical protein
MERTALLWKAVHMVSAVRKWSEEVDYQGLAMRYQAEEFVFFVCFGSLISHLIHFVLCKHASGLSLQDGTKMELVCKDDLSPGSEAQTYPVVDSISLSAKLSPVRGGRPVWPGLLS